MNISQSITVSITSDTAIASYRNGNQQYCTFIESGESLSLRFDYSSLTKLAETIAELQTAYDSLLQVRKSQIAKEFDNLHRVSPSLPAASSSESLKDIEIAF